MAVNWSTRSSDVRISQRHNCLLVFIAQAIVHAYETASGSQQDPSSTHAMLGVHASASGIIHYGKVARKHGQINSALDSLSRIHAIPSVPIVDCFQKIRQQVKCYLQMAAVMGKNECMQVRSCSVASARCPLVTSVTDAGLLRRP